MEVHTYLESSPLGTANDGFEDVTRLIHTHSRVYLFHPYTLRNPDRSGLPFKGSETITRISPWTMAREASHPESAHEEGGTKIGK